jgi:hypothetical protein
MLRTSRSMPTYAFRKQYIVTCLDEYQNYRVVIPNELGKGVSAVIQCWMQTDISIVNQ